MDLLRKKYPHLKERTRERRFYDCKKKLGEQPMYHYLPDEKYPPDYFRLLQLEEMQRLKGTVDRALLRRYGFKEEEINWLEDEGKLNV